MPNVHRDQFYRIGTQHDLVTDIAKCIQLYEVSTYLQTKIETSRQDYLTRRSLKPTPILQNYIPDQAK